jgi:invasion protein IalB
VVEIAFTLPILAYYSRTGAASAHAGTKGAGMKFLRELPAFVAGLGAAVAATSIAASVAYGQAAAPTAGATLLGQYGDWGAYTASPGGKKVCFALAKPASSATIPPNRPRDPAWLFISTRPAEKVKEEVSVIIGYPFKPNSDASVEVGGTAFAMYTQNDGAWIKNAAEEARLVEALRKGADVTVRGESGRGTKTTDTFSLKGISQALDRTAQECR